MNSLVQHNTGVLTVGRDEANVPDYYSSIAAALSAGGVVASSKRTYMKFFFANFEYWIQHSFS